MFHFDGSEGKSDISGETNLMPRNSMQPVADAPDHRERSRAATKPEPTRQHNQFMEPFMGSFMGSFMRPFTGQFIRQCMGRFMGQFNRKIIKFSRVFAWMCFCVGGLAVTAGVGILAWPIQLPVMLIIVGVVLGGCGVYWALLHSFYRQGAGQWAGQGTRQSVGQGLGQGVGQGTTRLGQANAHRNDAEQLEDMRWALKDTETRLREILDAQDEIILRHDPDGRVMFVNSAFCRKFGVARDDVIGDVFRPDIVPQYPSVPMGEAAQDASSEQMERIHDATYEKDTGEKDTGEEDTGRAETAHDWPNHEHQDDRPLDGLKFDFSDEATLLEINTTEGARLISWQSHRIPRLDGDGYDIQAIGRDITEQKAFEAQLASSRDAAEAANRAKSKFLAVMSHEIRTPMNGILGMAGLMRSTELTQEQTTFVRAIDQSARTLLALLDELLDFSRIEAGRLEIAAKPFDMNACLQNVIELLAPRAFEKQIDLAWSISGNIPALLEGDEARIRQVLLNLISNAIKFTDTGGVCVRLVKERFVGKQLDLRVDVVDTGRGMTEEQMQIVFDEFERGSVEQSVSENGSGLGLAIAKKLARAMGGEIAVRSVVGEGSTFTFQISLPIVVEQTLFEIERGQLMDKWILLALERGVERTEFRTQLQACGAKVIEADNSKMASEIVARMEPGSIDAVVVDGGSDPLDAGHLIQKVRAGARNKTVLGVMTTRAGSRDTISAMRVVGFERYLVRPVRPQSLIMILSDASWERDDADLHIRNEAWKLPASREQSLRVLLAEDNDINALLAETVLQKMGCTCLRVRDGMAAVETIEGVLRKDVVPFDLILLDLSMPRLDGMGAMHKIRELFDEAGVPCPLIAAVTANAFASDKENASAAGMDAYITKPFEPKDLTGLLDRCAMQQLPALAS